MQAGELSLELEWVGARAGKQGCREASILEATAKVPSKKRNAKFQT